MKSNSKFSKPPFHSVKPLKNNCMFNDSCILLRDYNHRCAQGHGAGEVSSKVWLFTFTTFTIARRNFLGNRGSFFVSCQSAVCLHALHEEIRGMGNWRRAELRLLRAKMDPFRQWCTCSIFSIFSSALTEKQVLMEQRCGALLQLQ